MFKIDQVKNYSTCKFEAYLYTKLEHALNINIFFIFFYFHLYLYLNLYLML